MHCAIKQQENQKKNDMKSTKLQNKQPIFWHQAFVGNNQKILTRVLNMQAG